MADKKIENFLINTIHMKPDKVVFNYLVGIIKHWDSGGSIKGSLAHVSPKQNMARQSLYRYINDVSGTDEYYEVTGSKYPMSPNSFLAVIYEKYLRREV